VLHHLGLADSVDVEGCLPGFARRQPRAPGGEAQVSPPRKPKDKVVKAAAKRSVERALQEERLAIAAIVKVMLIEVPDPGRVLARLDAMTRAAEANPRVPPTIRRQLIDATRFVRTAIERERGKPQSLFEPHVGHVAPKDVDALVAPTRGPQQLGLVNNTSVLGDVEAAHEDRVRRSVRCTRRSSASCGTKGR